MYPSIHLSIYPSIHLSIYLSIYLNVLNMFFLTCKYPFYRSMRCHFSSHLKLRFPTFLSELVAALRRDRRLRRPETHRSSERSEQRLGDAGAQKSGSWAAKISRFQRGKIWIQGFKQEIGKHADLNNKHVDFSNKHRILSRHVNLSGTSSKTPTEREWDLSKQLVIQVPKRLISQNRRLAMRN